MEVVINSGTGRTTNNKEDNTMKTTLLLAALIALAGVSTMSAGERLVSPRGKNDQKQFVRAEARVLGGRADRAVILASPQASPQKAKAANEKTPVAVREKSLGGRNNPR